MAHWCAEIIVPISAVQPITFMEIHHIGHFGQVVPLAGHIGGGIHDVNAENAGDGDRGPATGRDQETTGNLIPLHGKNRLCGEVHIHPMV